MCTTCGCSQDDFSISQQKSMADVYHNHHVGRDRYGHDHDIDGGVADRSVQSEQEIGSNKFQGSIRILQLEQDILSKNRRYAEDNRRYLRELRVHTLNLVSSPGAGKTTLLIRSIQDLSAHKSIAVIEGDQQTSNDAEQIAATGVQAIQINTGKGCHLDAHMIGHALEKMILNNESLLFIENVGNLVCPADFDLGEARRVVILSVVEGDDKPLKYPNIFASADLMVLTKVDLLPYVSFDVDRCTQYAKQINSSIEVIKLSSKTGEGLQQWYDWLLADLTNFGKS